MMIALAVRALEEKWNWNLLDFRVCITGLERRVMIDSFISRRDVYWRYVTAINYRLDRRL